MLLRLWLLVAAAAMAVQLGTVPLFDSDEGRNAEVAREMALTNDYVMPRLNGLPYLDKPIVYFAAEAAVMEVLGPTELAARLPAYLFTLATAALIFWFARRIGADPYVASIIFLTTPLVIAFARTVIFDSALMFFVTAALIAFYEAVERANASSSSLILRPSSLPSILAWLAMGFAMITKGPVTFILVLFVMIPYAWRRKAVRVLFPIAGLIGFAAIVAPWVWGVTRVVPEFLEYVLVTETAARMATDELKRTGPPWYFVPFLVGGALPWSIVAIFSFRALKKRDHATLFLLLWLVIPFVFFSISQSKRPQYIVPLMPPIALLLARMWDEAKTRAAAIALTAIGAILLVAIPFLHRTKMKPEIAATADETALALGLAFLAGGVLALLAKRRELVLVALTIPLIAAPAATTPVMRGISERRSAKSFVEELRPHLTPQTQVIGIEAFTGSLAFYLQRPVTVVTSDATELTSNYLMRRYERYTTDPSSPLKPLSWLAPQLAAPPPVPRVFIVRRKDAQWHRVLEARGMRQVADGVHHLAYR